jgi:type VI secretion system protein ImpF
VAELTPQERLQPSLLDRLTDDEPHAQQESRDRRVISTRKLKEAALRDLGWLLNTTCLAAAEDLDGHPEVARSVLNFGIPDLTGFTASNLDAGGIERQIRQAIIDFEPRIMPESVRVMVRTAGTEMNHNALVFEIEGELWGQPLPQRLYLKTEIDLETGHVAVAETNGSR